MPELPDVDVYRQYLNSTALHQRIEEVSVAGPEILNGTSPQNLGRSVKGKAFGSSRRHGKYLFVDIEDGDWLLMHFGMTGYLKYYKHNDKIPDYTQALFSFENGYHLAYVAPRKLGRIAVVASPEEFLSKQKLGPDALALTEKEFIEMASGYNGSIKSMLMKQQLIAGIGNIYSDEILFQAKLHPTRAVNQLNETSLKQLYRAIQSVLQTAIKAHAEPDEMPSSFLLPHRAKGERCPRCNSQVEKFQVSGRTSWFCPRCQEE